MTAPSAASTEPIERPPRPPSTGESIKETIESIIIAFVLAFVFRAYVVEAFVIPTGSMAPTLLGQHVPVNCAQCGYHFAVDLPEAARFAGREPDVAVQGGVVKVGSGRAALAVCPMCHFDNLIPSGTRTSAGDRILVHKYIYSVSEPRRWDVVVFKNPQLRNDDQSPGPEANYIKRLVGLPGEEIRLIEGNAYVKGPGAAAGWRIARKTHPDDDAADSAPRERVQRAVWQPVYHSQYVPLDGGRLPPEPIMPGQRGRAWRTPWEAGEGGEHWALDGRRSYVFDAGTSGSIHFDFRRAVLTGPSRVYGAPAGEPLRLDHIYNQFKHRDGAPPLEDVRLAVGVQPGGPGLAVTLQTTARWENSLAQPVALRGRLDASGQAWLESQSGSTVLPITPPVRVPPLTPGITREIELWYVDQELSLWVDGRCVAQRTFEVPMEALMDRPMLRPTDGRPEPWYPEITLAVQGAPVTLHRVQVDRDLYYQSNFVEVEDPRTGERKSVPGLGAVIKSPGNAAVENTARLEADQFYCLGDNSPMSADSRHWTNVDPWIRERYLAGSKLQTGVVPRRLMMGRAFFVYFPAPHRLANEGFPIIPNFGQMRFIH